MVDINSTNAAAQLTEQQQAEVLRKRGVAEIHGPAVRS